MDDTQLRRALSQNVPRLRDSKKLSQQALADLMHVHRVTVAKIEGGTMTPGGDLLFSLADALEVAPDALREIP